jgi:hypothetical protein
MFLALLQVLLPHWGDLSIDDVRSDDSGGGVIIDAAVTATEGVCPRCGLRAGALLYEPLSSCWHIEDRRGQRASPAHTNLWHR